MRELAAGEEIAQLALDEAWQTVAVAEFAALIERLVGCEMTEEERDVCAQNSNKRGR